MAIPSKFHFTIYAGSPIYTAEKQKNGDYIVGCTSDNSTATWNVEDLEKRIGPSATGWTITETFPEPVPDKFFIQHSESRRYYTVTKEAEGYVARGQGCDVPYADSYVQKFLKEGTWVVVPEIPAPAVPAPAKVQEHNGIKIGDRVEVADNGQAYSSYNDWAAENDLTRYRCTLPENGSVLRVVAVASHRLKRYGILFGLQDDAGVQYIIGHRGVKLVPEAEANGVDADGNPLNFTEDMLQCSQRVVARDGMVRIVLPNVQKEPTTKVTQYSDNEWALVGNGGWIPFKTTMSAQNREFEAVAVYAAPNRNYTLLDPTEKGALIWKAEDPAIKAKQARAEELQRQLVAAAEEVATATERMNAIKEELQAI